MTKYQYRSDRTFSFHVDCVGFNQKRYGDTTREYIITDLTNSCFRDDDGNEDPNVEHPGIGPGIVEQFCRACISLAKKPSGCKWHESRYTFESFGNRKYKYTVTEPNLD